MVGVSVGHGHLVSVALGVQVGTSVYVEEGVKVGVGVNVMVGVRLGVQVPQWVLVGRGVQVGANVLEGVLVIEGVREIVGDRVGVSVGASVLVETSVSVWVSEGVMVKVDVGMGVRKERFNGWATAPVIMKETQAMDIRTKRKDRPKNRQPEDLWRLRSGQLALLRLTCIAWIPARKLKKAPNRPRRMAIMRPVRKPIRMIIAYGIMTLPFLAG